MVEAKAKTGNLRGIKIPQVFEIFNAVNSTGSFSQVSGPFMKYHDALDAFNAFCKHPDFVGAQLFIVRVERYATKAKFDTTVIGPRRTKAALN